MSRRAVKQALLIKALRELIKYKERIKEEICLGVDLSSLGMPVFYLSSKGLEQKGGTDPGMLDETHHDWLVRQHLQLSLDEMMQLIKELKET